MTITQKMVKKYKNEIPPKNIKENIQVTKETTETNSFETANVLKTTNSFDLQLQQNNNTQSS